MAYAFSAPGVRSNLNAASLFDAVVAPLQDGVHRCMHRLEAGIASGTGSRSSQRAQRR